jgi:hypothetical protein
MLYFTQTSTKNLRILLFSFVPTHDKHCAKTNEHQNNPSTRLSMPANGNRKNSTMVF